MATAQQVIEIAKRYLGVTENPPGSNRQPFAAIAGHANGQFWCVTFTRAMFVLANAKDLCPNSAGVVYTQDWYRQRGQLDSTPKVGDLGMLKTGTRHSGPTHIGIVVAVGEHSVWMIEGNTSSDNAGSQDNGGGVFLRRRERRFSGSYPYFTGFGHPAYAAQENDLDANQATQLSESWQRLKNIEGAVSDLHPESLVLLGQILQVQKDTLELLKQANRVNAQAIVAELGNVFTKAAQQ